MFYIVASGPVGCSVKNLTLLISFSWYKTSSSSALTTVMQTACTFPQEEPRQDGWKHSLFGGHSSPLEQGVDVSVYVHGTTETKKNLDNDKTILT